MRRMGLVVEIVRMVGVQEVRVGVRAEWRMSIRRSS
jgi:hypothetical protein